MFGALLSAYRWVFLQLASVLGTGWAIVALSFLCSALMAPLMKAVAGVVRREKEYEDVILPQVEAINAAYATDRERNLHIQRLYARYAYSPICAVKKVLPLFVQIPFLLLTYYMLKGTAEINGVAFLFLEDLGKPDALLAGFNLLPFAMTLVNVATVFATPGFTKKDWTQAIGIALLFLVLLYTAPAALLLYWTLTNAITFARTLAGGRFAGARLLGARLALARLLPALTVRAFVRRPEWFALPSLLATAYFGLVLYTLRDQRACFSFRVSYWGAIAAGLLLAVSLVSMAVLRKSAARPDQSPLRNLVRETSKQLYLLLLPVALAVHYSCSSAEFRLPAGSLCALAGYMLLPALAVSAVLWILFARRIAGDLLLKIGVMFCVGVYVLPMVSAESGAFGYQRNILLRLAVLALSVGAALVVRSALRGLVFTVLLTAFALFNAFSGVAAKQKSDQVSAQARMTSVIGDAQCVRSNNVYLLIYDSYGHETVLRTLGIHENDEMSRLFRENGFQIYDAYTTGTDTLGSMSAAFTLNGVMGGSKRATIGGDNVFCDFLRAAGYRTDYLLCSYTMPEPGERCPGDSYYPERRQIARKEAVIFTMLMRGVMQQASTGFNAYSHEAWLDAYRKVMASRRGGRHFIYAHSGVPDHAAWQPKDRKGDREEQLAYKKRVAEADEEIRASLRMVAEDRDAIVIVASDHGGSMLIPDPPGNYDMRHLLDHHGIMLAIRWPKDYRPTLQLDCLQNVLLEVMIYLSGDRGLARLRNPGKTIRMWEPICSPWGLVQGGIVQSGPHTGRSLFEAAAIDFGLEGKSADGRVTRTSRPVDLSQCRLSNATYFDLGEKRFVRCTGVLDRSWQDEDLAGYIAERQYIGLRVPVPPASTVGQALFLGRKVLGNGQPTVVLKEPGAAARIVFSKTYRELDDGWILYMVELPVLPNGAELIFNGGYTDRTGSPDSCYEFKDIRLATLGKQE